jgi:O-antigen/teichoic acid export membrane protein
MTTPSNTLNLVDAAAERGLNREHRLKKTVVISVVAKAVRFGSQLLIVGMATRYLGPERYGLWMVVMAALSWLSWGQVGIGPGLVNAIAEADGKKDEKTAGEHFTSALYAITAFGLIALLVISLVLPWVNWAALLGVESPSLKAEIPMLILVSAILLLLRFPMSVFEVGYNAYQLGYMARWWDMLGQILSVVAVVVLIQASASLAWLVLGLQGATELAILAGGLFLILKLKPHLMPRLSRFKLRSCRRIFHTGAGFLLIQIAAYLVMQSGLLVLSHHHGPAAVTPYSVTWQLCQMGSGVWMMFAVNLWAAFGEARSSGDWLWIEKTKNRLIKWTMFYATAFSFWLILFGQPIIKLWAGGGAVPDQASLSLIAIYSLLFSWTVVHAMILNGLNVVWKQTIGALLNGVLALALSLFLVPVYGVAGLALSLIGAIILSNGWITSYLLRKEMALHVR